MALKNFSKKREAVCAGCLTYVLSTDLQKMTNIMVNILNKDVTEEDLQCSIEHMINGIKCPCSSCIVKMMCDQSCEKFDNYTGNNLSLSQALSK